MPSPMAPRFPLLFLAILAAAGSSGQTPPAPPAPPPTVVVRTSVSYLDPKTGKSDLLTAPSVSALSGSEARVSVAGRPDPKDPRGKPESGMELVISPTVQPDGTVSIALRVSVSTKIAPPDPKSVGREGKRDAKSAEGTLVFHSVLTKEGLFSLHDSRSARRWYQLGAVVDGWKLEAFDAATNTLTVAQGSTRQELLLYKSSVEASASELSTVVLVRPGETVKVPGVGGLEVSVSASVSATPVAR